MEVSFLHKIYFYNEIIELGGNYGCQFPKMKMLNRSVWGLPRVGGGGTVDKFPITESTDSFKDRFPNKGLWTNKAELNQFGIF